MLDINQIVQAKLAEMADSKILEDKIQQTLEQTILQQAKDVFSDYEFRKIINKKLTEQLASCFEKIDFTSYNGFILDTVSNLIENQCKADIVEKAKKSINNMLFVKRESIKLSWLADKYTKYLNDSLDEEEKYGLSGRWNFEIIEDSGETVPDLTEIQMSLHESSDRWSTENHKVNLGVWSDGRIYRCRFEDRNLKEISTFGRMSDFEILLINLVQNETILEFDDDCPSTSLDIDV